jgi:hypothetical protein
MSTATLTPTTTMTAKPPRYPWRTIRHDGTVNHYGSQENRAKGARKWSDADQEPVRMERWTPERGWHVDITGHGTPELDYAEPSPDGFDFGWMVQSLGWIKDGVAPPICQQVGGLRVQYRCLAVSHEKTGYCIGHQHVYRSINGIPEPAPQPRDDDDDESTDHHLRAGGPLTGSELKAMADDADFVTVDVACPSEVIKVGTDAFAAYLGERVTGRRTFGLRYWVNGYDNVYAVTIDLLAEQDPHDMLREARALTDGRARHRAVKRARDLIRAQRRRRVPNVVVDLKIENGYELYNDVTSYVWHAVVPAPPADRDSVAYQEWESEYLFDLTGTGRLRGDSWRSGVITWSSDPALTGLEF